MRNCISRWCNEIFASQWQHSNRSSPWTYCRGWYVKMQFVESKYWYGVNAFTTGCTDLQDEWRPRSSTTEETLRCRSFYSIGLAAQASESGCLTRWSMNSSTRSWDNEKCRLVGCQSNWQKNTGSSAWTGLCSFWNGIRELMGLKSERTGRITLPQRKRLAPWPESISVVTDTRIIQSSADRVEGDGNCVLVLKRWLREAVRRRRLSRLH